MKKFLLSLFISSIILSSCSNNENEENTLILGFEAGYAPYNYSITESEKDDTAILIEGTNFYADGYDVQIAKIIADGLDKELVVKKLDWDGLIPALNSKTIDIIIAGMSPTEERKNQISFSDSYFSEDIEIVVVTKLGNEFANAKNLDEFEGAKIGAQLGTFHIDLLGQLNGIEEFKNYEDFGALINALNNGSIDGYLCELVVANTHVENNEDFKYISFVELNNETFELKDEFTSVSIGLRKEDEELLQQINEILSTVDNDTRNRLMQESKERMN